MANPEKWHNNINSQANGIQWKYFRGVTPFSKIFKETLEQLNLFQNSLKISSPLKLLHSQARVKTSQFKADKTTFENVKKVLHEYKIDAKHTNDITHLITSFQNNYILSFLNEPDKQLRKQFVKELKSINSGFLNSNTFDPTSIKLTYPNTQIEIKNPAIKAHLTDLIKTEIKNLSVDTSLHVSNKKINQIELEISIKLIRYLIANKIINTDVKHLNKSIIKKSNFVLIQALIECSGIPFIDTPNDIDKFPVYINKIKATYWEALLKAFKRHFEKGGEIESLIESNGWLIA